MPATVSTAAGDHNGDGRVDAADYVTWRSNPAGHGGNPGYTLWRANFGNTAQGAVFVNSGGTLAVNAGGTNEWTDSTNTGAEWNARQSDRRPRRPGQPRARSPGCPEAPWQSIPRMRPEHRPRLTLTYTGVIGGFRTAGGGTTDAVGFTKRGTGTLTLRREQYVQRTASGVRRRGRHQYQYAHA